ncbi:hypothetical protein [Neolewinella agarilytica]|uniref:hypothetical protein n=1 Tax=Neolewinella agarilytica TaxID=478744 RepID=UPI002352DD0A|nr:hypothetical protein [Neolewinella agarilytica]
MTRSFFLLLASCFSILLTGQSSPRKPDPNKCYVRTVTLDVYETEVEEYLTYSEEEAALYPHKLKRVITKPEISKWESTRYDGCESSDPNDCQVLCYRTYPAEYTTIYRPKDKSLGKSFYKEITRSLLIEKGGLTSYKELDCKLTSYQPLGPIDFSTEEGFQREEERILQEILYLLDRNPSFRIDLQFRYAGELPESEAEKIEAYLIEEGAKQGNLIVQYLPDDQLTLDELEIYWRVANMDL